MSSNDGIDKPPRMTSGAPLSPAEAALRTAVSSMFPYNVEDYRGRRGRTIDRVCELTGLTKEEFLISGLVLDAGSGPEAAVRDGLLDAAKELGMSEPPQVISLSLGYANESIRKNLIEKTESAEGVVAADIEALPFPNNTFPYVIAVHLFTHLHEDKLKKAVAEVARVLAPGGKLVIVPLLAPKERKDYEFELTDEEAEQFKLRALDDEWVQRSVYISGLISEEFRGKGKVTVRDLPPAPGSEVQLYKLRRITAEKAD